MSDRLKKHRSSSESSEDSNKRKLKEKEHHKKSKKSHEKKSKHKKHRREHSRDRDRDYDRKKYDDDYRRKDRHDRNEKEKTRKRHDSDEDRRRRRSRTPDRRRRNYTPETTTTRRKPSENTKEVKRKSPEVQSSPEKSSTSSTSPVKVPNVKELTTPPVESAAQILPSYYNPKIVNASKFAEQERKRKLLWSKKDEQKATWTSTTFSQDNDGSKANKFLRLMGVKDVPKVEPIATTSNTEQMFSNMEQQYEVARTITHLSRGSGLGYK